MSLRFKLLLLGLATLVLPWAGCRYAREMESALREGETNSLLAVAQTIGSSLQGRNDLLYREHAAAADSDSGGGPGASGAAGASGEGGASAEAIASTGANTAAGTGVDAGNSVTSGASTAASAGASNGTETGTSAGAAGATAATAPPAEHGSVPREVKPSVYDLRPILLTAPPYLDGYADEWPQAKSAWQFYARDYHEFGILTGVAERMLYVLLEVRDDHLVFDAPGASPLDPSTFGDRIWLGFEGPDGLEHQVFVASTGPGSVTGRRIVTGEYGQLTAVNEPRIVGAWQPTPQGYRVELRVPLSMLGERFGVLIDDRDKRGADPVSYGTLRSDDLHTVGRLIVASPELTTYLHQFTQPGLRLSVSSPDGRLLAQADASGETRELPGSDAGIPARLYRRFVDRSGATGVINSIANIYDREHLKTIATLQVSQTVSQWQTLRDRALTRMLNLTLIISAVAVIAIFIFAARLAVRLSRLRAASESALTRDGLVTTFPETDAPDELGDVARGFSTLLGRLHEYTGYLRTLAGKLAHEIRTPLTIVRSSLENLESEGVSASAGVYLERARHGSERLNAILVAMGAATRVEEAIGSAERTRFDLVPVIASAVDSYRIAFRERGFASELPAERVEMDGAPDLIVQMLDKLVDNAVDFTPPGGTITVRLTLEPHAALVEVDNPGPPLSPDSRDRLFESLWQSRTDKDSRPHFGLGLYIVRLIAEFHSGQASASSLPGDAGARFSIRLPR